MGLGSFGKLLKFLHWLTLIVGVLIFAASIYLTVRTWPDQPKVDPKIIWVAINVSFFIAFLFFFNKARPYRPHIGIKNMKVKRILSPEERATIEHWRSIRAKAFSRDPSQMQQAIIEADKLVDQALASVGFTAETTIDKIYQILVDELGWIRRAAIKANQYRQQIIDLPLEEIDPEDVQRAIQNYEVLLKELDVVDPAEL